MEASLDINASAQLLKSAVSFFTYICEICDSCSVSPQPSNRCVSVKLKFNGALNQAFVRQIAKYAFSHNVQELNVVSLSSSDRHIYPPCLFSSQSLKHFTLTFKNMIGYITSKTPWDFSALTTLHLSEISLFGDLFSNCVNLKNLTLERFCSMAPEVFDIITPRLSNLILIEGVCWKAINVIAPQLENLTLIHFSIEYLNVPPGISSLCYKERSPCQLSKDRFHSLNKVSICLSMYDPKKANKEEVACKTIDMLQEVHSARYLTLNANIVEFISSFPHLLLHRPSPFSNLICLTIDSSMKKDGYKLKMSTEARDFFLQNSPSATLIMKSPKEC